jgi:hypothetical protein
MQDAKDHMVVGRRRREGMDGLDFSKCEIFSTEFVDFLEF